MRVEYALVDVAEPPVARFRIDEGPRVLVRELAFTGLAALNPEQARAFFGAAARGGAYAPETIEAGVKRLRARYFELGHLRIAIDEPAVEFTPARDQATLTIAVHEGPAFRVRALDVTGGVPEMTERERALAHPYIGRRYAPEFELELRNALLEAYAHRGYPDTALALESAFDEESGDVRLALRVTPGERVHVGHIVVRGNKRTRVPAIEGLLGIEEGELYDSERVRAGFRELYATGLFETLRITPAGEGPVRDLVVEVEEARSVRVRVEPGWGSYEGPRVLLGIDESNFRGLGQRLGLEGSVSDLAQEVRASWVDPRFFGTPFTAEMTVFAEQREEPSFEFSRVGAGWFLRRRWNEDWSSSVGYEFQPTNVLDDQLQVPLSPDVTDDADVAMLSTGIVLETRDNQLLPTRGKQVRGLFEWADDAFGSQVEFLRLQLEYTQLFRLGSQFVLAGGARTGVIAPFGSSDTIPLPERFFNGGENSVRSFEEDELGPKDPNTNEPIGGESATTLSLELRRPIAGSVAGALFVDSGNVTQRYEDYFDFPDFRYGVGVGLRYLLPIGPLRLDLAANPDPDDEEDEYVLHFSVGFPF